jgi:ubiquinone/menaquinone biosynthesis C-methylase UbiE
MSNKAPGARGLRSSRTKAAGVRRLRGIALLPAAILLAACQKAPETFTFPDPQRPVAPIVSARFSNEDARDSVGEFETVVRLAGVAPGMWVADVGAGEGYYTVRLAPLVGEDGRVLAQDIVPETRDALAQRVHRENLENVAVKLGEPNDPKLPAGTFDRVFLIHMYHEIERPSEFLWNLRPALKKDGSVVIVDADRPTDRHGTPPKLLLCELSAVGYELVKFERLADSESYFAQFAAKGPRPEPNKIKVCPAG